MEGIGIALDVPGDRMFLTDLAGSVYSARLDGSEKRSVCSFAQGNLTGIAYRRTFDLQRKETSIMPYDKPIHRVAIVGTGVIGASWAAQYLARGFDVVATDPAPNAEANLRKYVDEAWEQLEAIGLSAGRIARPLELHDGHEDRRFRRPTSSKKTAPSGRTSKSSCSPTWMKRRPSIRSSPRVRRESRPA